MAVSGPHWWMVGVESSERDVLLFSQESRKIEVGDRSTGTRG